jgi:N-acetylglucosamine kinase-like BadF-type ATPase
MVCIVFLPKVLRQFATSSTRRMGGSSHLIADYGSADHLAHLPNAGERGCSEDGRGAEEGGD